MGVARADPSDLLFESFLKLVKRNPLFIFLLPFWLLRGNANLKRQIASRVSLAVELLPYNQEFLDFLRTAKSHGRKLVLATSSDELLARPVADYLQIFDEVIANDGVRNLAGSGKARLLVERFGEKGFDYAGDSHKDLPVWSHAGAALAIAPARGVLTRLKKIHPAPLVFQRPGVSLKLVLKALRVHQWVKNTLLFVPLIMAHLWLEPQRLQHAVIAFFAFCLLRNPPVSEGRRCNLQYTSHLR